MMTMLNFMTAIYWGQLSHCETITTNVSQYTCYNRSAYGAVSFFAVVLFLLQLGFTGGAIVWRGELINDGTTDYQEINQSRPHNPYEGQGPSSHYAPPSADL